MSGATSSSIQEYLISDYAGFSDTGTFSKIPLQAAPGSACRNDQELVMTMSPLSRLFTHTLAAILLAAFAVSATAQSWPTRPIRIIVPQAPGGANDVVARLIANSLGTALKQSVIVENRPGAGALLGTNVAANADPDGYTLLAFGDANTFPTTIKLSGRDPITSFAPITLSATGVHVFVAHPSLPANNLSELIAYAKQNPTELSAAVPSLTGVQFVALETLKSRAGISITAVPYKGGGQAVIDVVAGQVKLGVLGMAPVMTHIKSGRLKAIAVTGSSRTSILPNVPTIAESGFPGFETSQWLGLVAPANTPPAIINRLHAEMLKVTRDADFVEKLAAIGLDSSPSASPAEFGKKIRDEVERWPAALKAAGVKVE